ncbi:MAG: hypothetical protein HZA84_04490 [Thaumarchaeota archaeon]|nr:hypothetical protein [Nitrososphaerota archaeon]
MKFNDFWALLKKETTNPITLRTLDQEKEFEAKYTIGKITIIPESSGEPRPIDQSHFRRVWNNACNKEKSEQLKPGNYQHISVNASYIVALMSHIVIDKDIECESVSEFLKRRQERYQSRIKNNS